MAQNRLAGLPGTTDERRQLDKHRVRFMFQGILLVNVFEAPQAH